MCPVLSAFPALWSLAPGGHLTPADGGGARSGPSSEVIRGPESPRGPARPQFSHCQALCNPGQYPNLANLSFLLHKMVITIPTPGVTED